ncbi:DUF2953 domain-containing protein [Methanocalculus sp.]|uniref:DUF2953 domain-containing protein n=1 Tax=Methanocalculus sp. TaxID=2004547 RepID=UPI0027269235|nr:DUF2953 domain-containing protein [Methanocalculus sp.]MDO8842256.1 DUF2953 domain-containing protein [Methanocalculus sp.]
MDLFLIILALACLGGMILPFLISFCVTVSGSLDPEGWYARGSLGPITLLLLPGWIVEVHIFGCTIRSFSITKEEEEEREELSGEKTRFSIPTIPRLPISVDSVDISGRYGCSDAGDTGRIYGWISALRGALTGTRLRLSITPDFTSPAWAVRVQSRLRIRSLFHLVSSLIPMMRKMKDTITF